MEIRTKLSKEIYDFNKDSETSLLVELSAPKVEIEGRAPICIVPVLDVSGSMAGEKIEYLKKSCRKLIDHLALGDSIGIVAFDTNVYEVAEIREITQEQKEILKKKVSDLRAGSATNLSGALLLALKWINKTDLPENTILRIVVFTDGQANIGMRGRELLELTGIKDRASISAFGFGMDCDQELLADISNKSGGNYAFIDSPDSALTAFARELGGLMATYAQNIEISITSDKNNKIIEVLNDEDVEEKDSSVVIKLRDILGEEKKWLVAKVKLNKVENPLPRKVNAFSIGVSFNDRSGNRQVIESVPVKIKFCKSGEEPKEEDLEVIKHRDRLIVAKAMDKAEYYARIGDYSSATYTITNCRGDISDAEMGHLVDSSAINYSCSSNYNSKKGLTNSTRNILKGRRLSNTSKEIEELSISSPTPGYIDNMVDSFNKDEKNVIITNDDILPAENADTSSSKKKSGLDW